MASRLPVGGSYQTDQRWTNEKHVRFLNSVEAWFVRTMLEDNTNVNSTPQLRLDRHLPDSSDSTLDCRLMHSRKKQTTSVDFIGTRTRINGRPHRRIRRPSSQPYDSSQDQVVPQIENRAGDKDDKDLANASMESAN